MAAPQYMTPAGYEALVEQLAKLGKERTVVVKGVADAAAEGDRSENAEYIYGKKRLREIDKKMRWLSKTIDAAEVVDPDVDRGDRVFFGATVHVEDEDGRELAYQIVGQHETDARARKISYTSPVGAALMRKQVDDEVEVETPGGTRVLTVVAIEYNGAGMPS